MNPSPVTDTIKWAVGICAERGADFEPFLPKDKSSFTARDVINACGDALVSHR